jgi:hypothetical protein
MLLVYHFKWYGRLGPSMTPFLEYEIVLKEMIGITKSFSVL